MVSESRNIRSARRAAIGTICALLGGPAARATAADEGSPYCRKVRARAAADATLLRAPRLVGEALRFPSSNRIDLGPTVGDGFQLRAALTFSPTDAVRASLLERAGEADCRAHDAGERVRAGLEDLAELGRLPALKAQAAYLDAHRSEWRALLATAGERLAARVVTLVELQELRRLTQALERKSAEVAGEIDRLESVAPDAASPLELAPLAERYASESDAAEGALASLRALDPWGFKLTGGVIPPMGGRSADWFGLAEVSYSLGGPWRGRDDARAGEARADEVRHARDELPTRLSAVERGLRAQIVATRRELAAVEGELASTADVAAAMAGNDAPDLAHARATLVVERLDVESDRVFLRTLLDALTSQTRGRDDDR